jgi:hypothetical protein
MSKYVIITGDSNDGDYVTEVTKITDKQLSKLRKIVEKMPSSASIPYTTHERGDDHLNDSDYDYLSNSEKEFLDKFLPEGDPNCRGIHSIESIRIVEKIEDLF